MMKRFLTLLILITPFFLAAQHSHTHKGKVVDRAAQAHASHSNIETQQIFSTASKSANQEYAKAVKEGVVFNLNSENVAALKSASPEVLKLEIPFSADGSTIELDLVKKDIHAPGFRVQTSDGLDITETIDLGIHYRGMISGDRNSLVSISIFNNEVIGLISNSTADYTLGKLRDSKSAHILYDDKDINEAYNLNCAQEDDGVQYRDEMLEYNQAKAPGDCVNIYVEAGQTVYNSFASDLTNTTNFLNGVFAQSFVIYANEGITMQMSDLFIWTTPDPYSGPSSFNYRSQFQANTPQGGFNGDLGHLVEVDNVGGIAAGFSGICNQDTDQSLCFSGFSGTSFNNVPTYSFNVFLISHEMGHLMGSRHTHACVWNGNSTAIDGCSGFTEGGCALPPAANPGTVMSYCTPNIDFVEGFHPQPQAVMLNSVANATCLNPCAMPANNDDCADAELVTCGSVTAGTTIGMTTDVTPFCGTASTSPGVWYRVVGVAGSMTADVCGATHDSKISIYTGTCGALVCEIGEDDDFVNCGSNDPSVTWAGVSGVDYYIHVHGFGGGEGDFDLTVSCSTINTNDRCDGAIQIACNQPITGTTVGATADTAPFCGTGDGTGGGVWYTFDGDGSCVRLSTCNAVTNYDSRIRVFTGTCGALVCEAGDDDDPNCGFSSLRSTVEFVSVAGTTYYVLVHGFGSAEGDFQLDFECNTPEPLMVTCPPNQSLACGSSIPPPHTTSGAFIAAGGTISGGGCPGGALTYTVTAMGQLSGNTCNGFLMEREYTITSDITGEVATCMQTISVAAPNSPTITCPADIIVACEDEINLDPNNAVVTTDCGLGFVVYIKNPLAVGAPGCDGTVYTYIYKVIDDCGRVAECEQQVLIQNTPATIDVPAGGTVDCFDDIEISLGDASVSGGCADYNLYLDAPVVNGALGCPGATYTYTYRLVDVCGNSIEEDVVFTNANNVGPTIQAPVDITCECLAGVNPNGDNATVTTSCDAGYQVEVTGPQIFGTMDCPGTRYVYTYTVTDECGRSSSDQQTFTVQNGAPVFSGCEQDIPLQFNCEDYGGEAGTIAAIEAYIASVEAHTSCGVQLTVFNNFNSNNINTCINNGYGSITFRATDNCGRSSFCTTQFIVVDTEAPVIYEQAEDHWEICNYNSPQNFQDWVANHGGAEAYDECSTDNIFWSTIPANPSFDCMGAMGITSMTVTFVVRDNCGNTTSTDATFNAFMGGGDFTDQDGGVETKKESIVLYQNKPNPFKNETLISFKLPEASQAILTIYDINGRVLKVVEGDYAKGLNELSVNRSDLGGTGVVYYTLRTLNETATKIMVIMD